MMYIRHMYEYIISMVVRLERHVPSNKLGAGNCFMDGASQACH